MIYAILGTALLLIGWMFFYLNNNSPIQTSIPAFAFPIGAALVIVALVRLLS